MRSTRVTAECRSARDVRHPVKDHSGVSGHSVTPPPGAGTHDTPLPVQRATRHRMIVFLWKDTNKFIHGWPVVEKFDGVGRKISYKI